MPLMEQLDYILVFKTNIRTRADAAILAPVLSSHSQISQWTVDCEDVDCVLRVVSDSLCCEDIIPMVRREGYFCKELD
jgi:hypothetical protein